MSARFSLSMEMTRLTPDGIAEPILRDQNLRCEPREVIIIFPVQRTTSKIGNLTRLTLTLARCNGHIYTRGYNERALGRPWKCNESGLRTRGNIGGS